MTARFAQNNSLFSKNDGSFYTKQRLVFKKTTARFTQNNGFFSKNDGSLYTKQRLVFKKQTKVDVDRAIKVNPPTQLYEQREKDLKL